MKDADDEVDTWMVEDKPAKWNPNTWMKGADNEVDILAMELVKQQRFNAGVKAIN
jgi:hypothetical protein